MPPDFGGTQFETDDDIRSALIGLSRPLPAPVPIPAVPKPVAPALTPPRSIPAPPAKTIDTATKAYRPTVRPPMAYLVVCDDGSAEGETLRLRDSTFIIGRTEGDLLLPHDPLISGRHLEISRRQVDGRFRWIVTDLSSSHGLFVRVSKTPLADRAEFLVGQGRYRFDLPETGTNPGLSEILAGRSGTPFPVLNDDCWIGSDPFCDIVRTDDPFCHPKHARIFRNPNGGWSVEHPKTLNGLWLRVPHVTASDNLQFQIGEQRFKLRTEPGKSE